ncbi:MAG: nuclear transport factor 2 family protein [Haliea sp.]|uniref:nuclear transport factor 2 family protein n=1 Tax=Marinobacter salarius TaxID=1420917 RepID=UPI0032ED10F5
MNQQIKPPFNHETAIRKVQRAEDLWNTRDPAQVALAYSENTSWRNRSEFARGREEVEALLARKWTRELDYRLRKQLFAFADNRIAVNFTYEYRDDSGQWFRAYGLEHWTFDEDGLMSERSASINELPIREDQRDLL